MRALTFFLMMVFGGAVAAAPRSLILGSSTFVGRSLGSACYAVDSGGIALPCNPAFISRETDSRFRGEFFFGNNVSYTRDASALLAGDGSEDNVRRLFSQTRGSDAEVNFEGGYRRPTWGVQVTPYRLVYHTLIRNQALPVVSLFASEERSLRAQLGGYAGSDVSWGVQVRGVQRRLISRTFTLTDILAEGGGSVLDPETQNALYIEPGLLKEWPHHGWRPQVTVALAQTGWLSRRVEEDLASPEMHGGLGVHPPLTWGDWWVGLDAILTSEAKSVSDLMRLGTSYEIGITRLAASASRSDHVFGFTIRYGPAVGGLTHQARWIENWLGETEWVRTTAFHLGVDW